MRVIKRKTIKQVYTVLAKQLLKDKYRVTNTSEIENCALVITKPSLVDFSFGMREISEKYATAELEWYWSGDNSCHTIGAHAKRWLAITDDGKTSNSAYGYILQKKYGFNQIDEVIALLRLDSTSRRAVLNISDPTINRIETKDMQCTVCIQFLVRNNKLNMTVYMRSNDIVFGLPYDYIYFMSIARHIALELGIEIGTYTHIAGSMHLYDSSRNKIIKTNKQYTF